MRPLFLPPRRRVRVRWVLYLLYFLAMLAMLLYSLPCYLTGAS